MSPKTYFQNKTIWITGASSGIGRALAESLAPFDCRFILSARSTSKLKEVAEAIGEDRCLILPLDLERYAHISEIALQTLRSESVDVLINNAGLSQRSLVADTDISVYEKLFNVNALGTIALTKAVLPQMMKQKSGHIVTISSVVGKLGTPMRSGYAASKHALHGFFDSLRAEVHGHNISVSLVCPGYIHTDISIHAVTADGTKHGRMDSTQASGMPVDVFAQKLLKRLAKKESEIYIGGKEILGIHIKRFFPRLMERIARKVNTG